MKAPRDPVTGPPPWRAWWLPFLALSAAAFLAWSQVFAGLLATRWLWDRLESRLAARPDHALEAALFAIDPGTAHGTVVFGGSRFVHEVRAAIGESGSVGVAVETDRLDTVVGFLESIESFAFERVLVQELPSFWSTYEPLSPVQRLDEWRFHVGGEPAPRDAPARVFWRALTEWAAGPEGHESERWERVAGEPSLMNVTFAFPPPRGRPDLHRLAALPASLRARLVWVADASGLPPDTPPDLVRDFRAGLHDPRTLGRLGPHVTLEALRTGGVGALPSIAAGAGQGG